jgi:hypothetical protein
MYELKREEVIKKYKKIAKLDERYDEVFELYDFDILQDEFDSFIRYQVLAKRIQNRELNRIYKIIDPKFKDTMDNDHLKTLIGKWIGLSDDKIKEYKNMAHY